MHANRNSEKSHSQSWLHRRIEPAQWHPLIRGQQPNTYRSEIQRKLPPYFLTRCRVAAAEKQAGHRDRDSTPIRNFPVAVPATRISKNREEFRRQQRCFVTRAAG